MMLICPNCDVELEFHPQSFKDIPDRIICPSCDNVFTVKEGLDACMRYCMEE